MRFIYILYIAANILITGVKIQIFENEYSKTKTTHRKRRVFFEYTYLKLPHMFVNQIFGVHGLVFAQ